MKSPAFVLAVMASGGVLPTVTFNGWLAYQKRAAEWHQSTTRTVKLNAYLIAGPNVLRVMVAPLEKPSGPLPPRAAPDRLRVWIYKAEHGRDPATEPELNLIEYEWNGDLSPIADDGLTEVLRHELRLKDSPGRWRWQDARPYVLGDRPALEAAVRELHATLAAGDAAGFTDRMSLKIEELARSTQREPSAAIAEQRSWLDDTMRTPGWAVEPLGPTSDLEVTASADGRLVQVERAGGGSPLRVESENGLVAFDLVFSRVGDRWVVVR